MFDFAHFQKHFAVKTKKVELSSTHGKKASNAPKLWFLAQSFDWLSDIIISRSAYVNINLERWLVHKYSALNKVLTINAEIKKHLL